MKISVAGFGFEFTLEEATQLAQGLLGVAHKDKKYICLLLNFSFSFLQDWYNEAKSAFMPVVIKKGFRNLSDEQKEKIYNFMTCSKYVPIANTLCQNFGILYDKRGELKKIIKDDEDFAKKLSMVSYDVKLFNLFAIEKNRWYEKVNKRDLDWDIDMEEYEKWRSDLQKTVNETNDKVSEVGHKLNCIQNDMIKVVKNYKEGKGL
jgi:hypothetical protein